MRHLIAFATIAVWFCASTAPAASIFINEFDYDQGSPDTNEFIEIAGNAGANLGGYVLELWNGANNTAYQTIVLPNYVFPNSTGTGWGFFLLGRASLVPPANYDFGVDNFIHDGAPDGIKLLDPSFNEIEFLSYEGTMLHSTDVGVQDNGPGSISKTGVTSGPNSGTWVLAPPTPGLLSGGQDLIPEPASLSMAVFLGAALLRRHARVASIKRCEGSRFARAGM